MLPALTEFFIAALELLEAEMRSLRRSSFRLGAGLALLSVAGLSVIAALGFFIWSFYLAIAPFFSPTITALLCGLLMLLLAGGVAWFANRLSR